MTITLARIGTNQTVVYAMEELTRYLKRMDCHILIDQRVYYEYDPLCTKVIWIGETGLVKKDKLVDEILIDVKNGKGIITGANPRAVLIAVYRFLRELGCRWIRPGDDGEIIPEKTLYEDSLTVNVHETPSLKYRCMISEGATMFEHFYNMINWMPKVGLNSYYLQFLTPMGNFNRWYKHGFNPHREEEELLDVEEGHGARNRLIEEITKRGLELFGPGHGWTMFPFGITVGNIYDPEDPRLTPEYKDCFAEMGGKREVYKSVSANKYLLNFTNLCYSQKEIRDVMTDAAVAYLKQNPAITMLAFALADGMNNHCECEECCKMRPADWLLVILNELDEKLTKEGMDTKVAFPLYVDTLWPPEKITLNHPDRFVIHLCPSSRTYSRPLYDMQTDPKDIVLPPYERNRLKLPHDVETLIALFNEWKRVVPCESMLFEYHLMWDHYIDPGYTSCANILHKDVTGLEKFPMTGFMSCQEHRCAFPTALPMYAMAGGMWDKNSKFEDISRDYYTASFGEDGAAVESYLARMSELFNPAFMRGDDREALKDVIERMDAIDQLVDEFAASHIEPNKDKNASWKYLWYHTTYAKMYAGLARLHARGDEKGIEEHTKAFTAYHFSMEPETHTVFDNWHFEDLYGRWMKRIFSDNPIEVEF